MSELATPVPAKMDEFMEKIRRGGVAQIINSGVFFVVNFNHI